MSTFCVFDFIIENTDNFSYHLVKPCPIKQSTESEHLLCIGD